MCDRALVLDRLDHVRVAVADPATVSADYATLLSPAAPPREWADGAWRLEVGATGLLLAPGAGESAGVQALVFAGTGAAPSERAARGIAIEIESAESVKSVKSAESDGEALDPAPASGAERLDHAVIITRDHEAAIRLYRDELGLRLALDRSFPERGVRILFFRLAGVTIEVAGPIESPADEQPDPIDRFGGLAWRGTDLGAWRERLLAEGFELSESRRGHKAGTRVCTVLDRTAGVPTLLIAPDPEAL